ncbi:MAG TPA: NAD(P)/FAD-dependent oxidoreductase [Burkholderiales bacterium]|nr:NAD(P)/FAD-dependent oxidoreductase [Burkholderiales bacterium]
MQHFDIAVIGAGAAGMMCAAVAGQRGKKVVLIDHAAVVGEKIRISGGGRCNFTNLGAGPANFLSENPHFCRSALARYTPRDFLGLLKQHSIAWHEKHRGQLFCDDSAEQVIAMLKDECASGQVTWRAGTKVGKVRQEGGAYVLETTDGDEGRATLRAPKLVIATGGLSIPKIGASDFGYRIAKQFGLKLTETRPALVPLTFEEKAWKPFAALSGLSLEVEIETRGPFGRGYFLEDLLLTHRGLSGPAVLQISSYWQPGGELRLNLLPQADTAAWTAAKSGQRGNAASLLTPALPKRLAEAWIERELNAAERTRPVADLPDKTLKRLAESLTQWRITPNGTEGYRKAEVTAGGVDTHELSSQSMEAAKAPGLHFIGEVVDVTGWLGGYNFQWAWASAMACAQAL